MLGASGFRETKHGLIALIIVCNVAGGGALCSPRGVMFSSDRSTITSACEGCEQPPTDSVLGVEILQLYKQTTFIQDDILI